MPQWNVLLGNNKETIKQIEDKSIQTAVTSPPYFALRAYGGSECDKGEIGLEETPEEFISSLCDVFDELKPKIKEDGTVWVNLGDTYASNTSAGVKKFGSKNFQETRPGRQEVFQPKKKISGNLKNKDLIGIPWMFAFEMRKRGWYLRQDIIWAKDNPMPESVTDRCTKSHEYIFLFSKSPEYYFDFEALKEETGKAAKKERRFSRVEQPEGMGRNDEGRMWVDDGTRRKRSVWQIPVAASQAIGTEHFATYPEELILPCILAGSKEGDLVFDPFNGSGTTGVVALKNGRNYLGCELYEKFKSIYETKLNDALNKRENSIEENKDLFEW